MVAVVEHVGHAFVIGAAVSSSPRLLDDPGRVVKIVAVQGIGENWDEDVTGIGLHKDAESAVEGYVGLMVTSSVIVGPSWLQHL